MVHTRQLVLPTSATGRCLRLAWSPAFSPPSFPMPPWPGDSVKLDGESMRIRLVGQPPWSPNRVTLRSTKTNEAVGVRVARMDRPQLGPGEEGLVAVEVDPHPPRLEALPLGAVRAGLGSAPFYPLRDAQPQDGPRS